MRCVLTAVVMLSLAPVALDRRPAAACSLAPRTQAYPSAGRVVAENAIARVLLLHAEVEPGAVVLKRDGVEVPATVEVDRLMLAAMHELVITPADELAPGLYQLSGNGLETVEFTVIEGVDVTAPGAPTDVAAHATYIEGDGHCLAGAPKVSLTLTPAEDDWTPADALAYQVYLAPAPDELALDDAPSIPALVPTRREHGRELTISNPGGTQPRASLSPGTWYVALRAIDEAGNLGPPSEPVAFTVPASAGCAAAGGASGAPAGLVVAVALLSRRRRNRRR